MMAEYGNSVVLILIGGLMLHNNNYDDRHHHSPFMTVTSQIWFGVGRKSYERERERLSRIPFSPIAK